MLIIPIIIGFALLIVFRRFRPVFFGTGLSILMVVNYNDSYNENSIGDGKYIGEITIEQQHKPGIFLARTGQDQEIFLFEKRNWEVGDRLFIEGRLQRPEVVDIQRYNQATDRKITDEFNFDKWLLMKGLYGSIHEPSIVRLSREKLDLLQSIRGFLKDSFSNLLDNDRHASLMMGMTIGDKSTMQQADYDQFVQSGLVHIIAVSGGNIIIVMGFLAVLLFRVPYYPRLLILFVAIIGYAALCGGDSSIVRATIMGCLGLLALMAGRIVSIRRLLAYARVAMLLRNPYFLIYDVGFVLSFSAIVGLVWSSRLALRYSPANKKIATSDNIADMDTQNELRKFIAPISTFLQHKKSIVEKQEKTISLQQEVDKVDTFWTRLSIVQKIKKGLTLCRNGCVLPTLGATFGVMPFLLFSMGKLNVIGVIANLFIVPIVPIVTVSGLIGSLLPDVRFVAQTIAFILEYIYIIAQYASTYNLTIIVHGLWYKVLILVVCLLGRVKRRYKTYFAPRKSG